MTALEIKWRQLAPELDASALEALASKGLLRRAQKDLERGIDIEVLGEAGTVLQLNVANFSVNLPDSGPAKSTCACPAIGVCQHILAAILFLQREPPGGIQQKLPGLAAHSTPSANPDKEWTAITAEQLEKWAGKAAFKAGLKLSTQSSPEIVRDRILRVCFPSMNAEAHFIPGGGLDGIIVSGGRGDGRQLVVAALVAFQRAHGQPWTAPAGAVALEATEGAPRSRAEVILSCQSLLEETLRNGLSRISTANQQRWATLAVSALGVHLPRLSLSLRGLGDEASLAVARDARGDLGRMLARMAQAHALCTALQKNGDSPRADLVGEHRTRYEQVGHLNLVGVAAWPWRTASGYEGLTVLFWDGSGKRWNSWSDSRPRHQLADFRPVSRFAQFGPWDGAESPRQLARSSFRLLNARRNLSGRLSASSKSRALVTGPARIRSTGIPTVTDWSMLESNQSTPVGLKEPNPLDAIFALQPATWAEHGFDPINQVFTWIVLDSQQRRLSLELAFDDFTESAIKSLEEINADSLETAIVIGRLQRTARGMSLHPYSLHLASLECIHLALDKFEVRTSPTTTATLDEDDDDTEDCAQNEPDEDESEPAAFNPALGRLLDEIDDALLGLAEAGMVAINPVQVAKLKKIADRIERFGLDQLHGVLGNLLVSREPRTLLRGLYVSQLHRRAMGHVAVADPSAPA